MDYIIDAHQDLAWNMHVFSRDYTRSVSETRQMEAGTQAPIMNGDTLLGWHIIFIINNSILITAW